MTQDPRLLPCLAAARAACPHIGDLELAAVVRAVVNASDEWIATSDGEIEWDSPLRELGPAVEWDIDNEWRAVCETARTQDDLNGDVRVMPPEELF